MLTEKIGGGVTLINYPNKWTANTEIDLGDGLYGYRATGTITASPGVRVTTTLNNSASALYQWGGEWYNGSAYEPIVCANAMNLFDGFYHVSSLERNGTQVTLITISVNTRTDAPYDVWCLYTK